MRSRTRRGTVIGAIVAIALAITPLAVAYSNYLSTWSGTFYPSSTSDDADCLLCHAGSDRSTFNAYGWAIYQDLNGPASGDLATAVHDVEGVNADADATGATNLKEIGANTQPGWTYGPNNTIYTIGGSSVAGQLPPDLGGLRLDPVTLVTISDDAFTPSVAAVKLGATVQWIRGTGSTNSHNVAEAHAIFRSGDPTTGAIFYNRTFSAGTFAYTCEAHAAMTGSIKVKPKVAAAPAGLPFTVTWATARSNTGDAYRVQYRVGSGSWRTWLASTTAAKAVFGKNGTPVTVKAGTNYGFRVASGTGGTWSGWSPTISFKA